MTVANMRAAYDALRLLVGDQGVKAFDLIYATVNQAEQRGLAEGYQDGVWQGRLLGRAEGNEEEFRDGWNAGWRACEETEDFIDECEEVAAEFLPHALAIEAGPDIEPLDEDFDDDAEMDAYLAMHKSPDGGYHGF